MVSNVSSNGSRNCFTIVEVKVLYKIYYFLNTARARRTAATNISLSPVHAFNMNNYNNENNNSTDNNKLRWCIDLLLSRTLFA